MHNSYLDVAFDYANAGLWADAIDLLESLLKRNGEECSRLPDGVVHAGLLRISMRPGRNRARLLPARSSVPCGLLLPGSARRVRSLDACARPQNNDAHAPLIIWAICFMIKNNMSLPLKIGRRLASSTPISQFPGVILGLPISMCATMPQRRKNAIERALKVNPHDHRVFYELITFVKEWEWPLPNAWRC